MKDRVHPAPKTRKRLLGTASLLAGVAALSSMATQFVAWRVQLPPGPRNPMVRTCLCAVVLDQLACERPGHRTPRRHSVRGCGTDGRRQSRSCRGADRRQRQAPQAGEARGCARHRALHVGAGDPAIRSSGRTGTAVRRRLCRRLDRHEGPASITCGMTGRSIASSLHRRAAARAWATSCRRCCHGRRAA